MIRAARRRFRATGSVCGRTLPTARRRAPPARALAAGFVADFAVMELGIVPFTARRGFPYAGAAQIRPWFKYAPLLLIDRQRGRRRARRTHRDHGLHRSIDARA